MSKMINSYKGIFVAINLTAAYHEKRWGRGYRSNSCKIQASTEWAYNDGVVKNWQRKVNQDSTRSLCTGLNG